MSEQPRIDPKILGKVSNAGGGCLMLLCAVLLPFMLIFAFDVAVGRG